MTRFSEKFLDETIEFWEPRYGKKLSRQDAQEIAENLTGFFRTVLEWERKEKDKTLNDLNDLVNDEDQ